MQWHSGKGDSEHLKGPSSDSHNLSPPERKLSEDRWKKEEDTSVIDSNVDINLRGAGGRLMDNMDHQLTPKGVESKHSAIKAEEKDSAVDSKQSSLTLKSTPSEIVQDADRKPKNGSLLSKEELDDLMCLCCNLSVAKVPKMRYKRVEDAILTICRLFHTKRHKLDWYVEELNRSEGHDWTLSQWIAFLHSSNFKMVKLRAYKGIGNFCYYNGSVFTTAGILGSCKCLREVRTGFGGKQGNRDILPDEELKQLYESEEIANVDINAFPDDSEIVPLKPIRSRMTSKRQSDDISQSYGLETRSLKNPKISYTVASEESARDSVSKENRSLGEADEETQGSVSHAATIETSGDMESTESSDNTTDENEKHSRGTSHLQMVGNISNSRKDLSYMTTDGPSDRVLDRNTSVNAFQSVVSDASSRNNLGRHFGIENDASSKAMGAVLLPLTEKIQEIVDVSLQSLKEKIEDISERVAHLEEHQKKSL
eukprot:jgi/Galph1/6045/GphlegSOOS_G4679.1